MDDQTGRKRDGGGGSEAKPEVPARSARGRSPTATPVPETGWEELFSSGDGQVRRRSTSDSSKTGSDSRPAQPQPAGAPGADPGASRPPDAVPEPPLAEAVLVSAEPVAPQAPPRRTATPSPAEPPAVVESMGPMFGADLAPLGRSGSPRGPAAGDPGSTQPIPQGDYGELLQEEPLSGRTATPGPFDVRGAPWEEAPPEAPGRYTPPPRPYMEPERVMATPTPYPYVSHEGAAPNLERILAEPYPNEETPWPGRFPDPGGGGLGVEGSLPPPRRRVPISQALVGWDDQPTALFERRATTPPPHPVPQQARRTTTSHGMVLHRASTGGLADYESLIGGPMDVQRTVPARTLRSLAHLPTLRAPDSVAASAYRILGQRVEEAVSLDFCRTVGVTSPGIGDGKSVTALNLAMVLSEEPSRQVVIVDCNLRRPGLAQMVGVSGEPGVVGIYQRRATLSDCLVRIAERELFLLPAGGRHPNPTEVLRSPVFTAIVRRLETDMGVVILDTPSLLPSADVSLMARLVDRFLVVVRAGHTRRVTLAESLARIEESKILGVVFNDELP